MDNNELIPSGEPKKEKLSLAKIIKTVIIVLIAAAILTGAGIGGLYYMGKSRAMPAADAVAIAVKDAGVDPANTIVKYRLGRDEGMFCYKVELYSAGVEYEYSIHSEMGAIVERDIDRHDSDEHDHEERERDEREEREHGERDEHDD